MKYKFILTIILLFICYPKIIFANNACVECLDDLQNKTIEGQDLIFSGNYDKAISLFQKVQKEYPESPAGFFGEAAVYEVIMLEDENFKYDSTVRDVVDRGIKVAKHVEAKSKPNLFNLFVAGSLYGLDGFFKARKYEWLAAYTRGVKSRQIFRRVKKLDPSFVDADFGDGMYLFWRSVYTKDLWFLKLFPDKRKEGIDLVSNVASNGRYSRDLAKINLGIMYFQEKKYSKAIEIFKYYSDRYPKNTLIHLLLGKVLLASNQYSKSRDEFKKVLSLKPKSKKPHYFIGLSYLLQKKELNVALNEFDIFLKLKPDQLWRSYSYYWKGRIFEIQGKKAEAKIEYEKAIELNKGLKKAKFRLQALGGGI